MALLEMLVRGIERKSLMLLDNCGIYIPIDDAPSYPLFLAVQRKLDEIDRSPLRRLWWRLFRQDELVESRNACRELYRRALEEQSDMTLEAARKMLAETE